MLDALAAHRRGLDGDPVHFYEDNVARLETAVRRAAATYLAAEPDDMAMTDSTTMGLGLVYGGMKLRPGQEILTDTHDHAASITPGFYVPAYARVAPGLLTSEEDVDATVRAIAGL